MLRVVLIVVGLALVLATPIDKRTDDEIQTYRMFLESFKSDNVTQSASRRMLNPSANPEETSGHYQGDIIIDDHLIEAMVQQYATRRSASVGLKWPDKTVVWDYGEGYFDRPQREGIVLAMEDIEKRTCIKFRRREPQDTVYVRISGEGISCYSDIGYLASRGKHRMNLALDVPGVGCFRHVTIVHELMHILGFPHMHSVYNRDNYIKIMSNNIESGYQKNFEIFPVTAVDWLNVEYDYVSCMHYGPYTFTSNGQKTIVALKEFEGEMGQRIYVTDKDWLRINRHYDCPGAWD